MATNPIQRRSRQSFMAGFLISLVIMAIVVVLLLMKISSLNEDYESAKEMIPQDQVVYTAATDIKSGDPVTEESFQVTTIKTGADLSEYLSPSNFTFEYNEDGALVEYIAKVDIPFGCMPVASMIEVGNEETAHDLRLVEYNMLTLPTQLKNGDYIDIRFMLPTGEDYIVISKKYVEQTTATTVWLKLTEEEILTMSSAIVDLYITEGSALKAFIYTDPGVQEAAVRTYPVRDHVLNLINSDKNIVEEARVALAERWNYDTNKNDGVTDFRYNRNHIDEYSKDKTDEEKQSQVQAGVSQESSSLAGSRSEYVSSLEGTGLVGYVQ